MNAALNSRTGLLYTVQTSYEGISAAITVRGDIVSSKGGIFLKREAR